MSEPDLTIPPLERLAHWVKQREKIQPEFKCRRCETTYTEPQAICPACGLGGL